MKRLVYLNLLFCLVFFQSCKGQEKNEYPKENSSNTKQEIYVGKEFYEGDELNNVEVALTGDISLRDSLSFTVYKILSSKNYIVSIEKLINNNDTKHYRIVDTTIICDFTKQDLELKSTVLNSERQVFLYWKHKEIKRWKYRPGNNNQTNAILEAWYGNYSLNVDYGKLDDLSEMSIQYDLTVTKDSIIFSGMGYKTFFTDLCKATENGDTLFLKLIDQIDGDGFSKHEVNSIVAQLYKQQKQYYLKSPVVADKSWNYNATIPILKK